MAEKSQETAAKSTASPRAEVPVFNCHVFLSPSNERGLITARVATLAGVEGQGHGEREALRSVVTQFKAPSAVICNVVRRFPGSIRRRRLSRARRSAMCRCTSSGRAAKSPGRNRAHPGLTL